LLRRSLPRMALLIIGTLLTPLMLWIRFAVLTPLAWLSPRLRQIIDERYSSVTLHPQYKAEVARLFRPIRQIRRLEFATTLYIWAVSMLVAAGKISLHVIFVFIAISLCVLLINMVRTIFAHKYSHDGHEVSHSEQIADSVTLTQGGVWVELFAPLGLRYHALHHIFPYMPYHALAAAHRRLLAANALAGEYYMTFYPSRMRPAVADFPSQHI
jgi:fatty acid desaturase